MIDTTEKAKIMQRKFGKTPDTICNGCKHLFRYEHNGQVYRKCRIYGTSASPATDWSAKSEACGLYPGKQYDGGAVIREVERRRRKYLNDAKTKNA